MKIHRISHFDQIPLRCEQWNSLVVGNDTNTPFQTYEWFVSWWKVFGSMNKLFFLVAYENGNVVGFAPLMIKLKKRRRILSFVGDDNADYCDFVVGRNKAAFLQAVIDYLLDSYTQWNSISLKNIPASSSTLSIFKKLLASNDLKFYQSVTVCPVILMKKDKYVKKGITSRTLKRHLNYFRKNGELQFKIFQSLEDAQAALEIFFEQHIRRRSITKDKSLFCDKRYKTFYKELLHEAWQSGWLFFSCLQFNKQQIAFHFGFDYGSKVIWYKPSFDIDYRQRSPGRILLKYLIEYCIDNDREEFDFTLGDEPFKQLYTEQVRINYNLCVFSSSSGYYVDQLFRRVRSTIKKAVKYLKGCGNCRAKG